MLAIRLLLDRLALAHTAHAILGYTGPLSRLRDELRQGVNPPLLQTPEQRAFLVFQLAQVLGWTPPELHRLGRAEWSQLVEDIEAFSFNTAISQMMIFVNTFTGAETIPLSSMRGFLVLLNPFAPHIASELWEKLNASFTDARGDITGQSWPSYDERLLVEDEVEVVLQINGKVRDRMKMSVLATDEQMKSAALSNPKIQERIAGKTVRNVIVVPRKLINIVV